MLCDTNFAVIPKIYPTKIKSINIRLLPFAVFDFKDLKIDNGHEIPKQITITASKICPIIYRQYRLM